ncbi:hypothetical protein TSOC_011208 [Tetrabaena socialis]|uniref:Uncharacterized protein n=1 Tax=Tetrabaena socialis TaxID=47790 RepID=A0A2J7ZR99_9CHLO|nr:hypothetical protein TSOC_011208 [Tetrabaena socialis]|eukprot:PNH02776.1 hypothetical protein TSOC_011208 [Tetrabaena socialis]
MDALAARSSEMECCHVRGRMFESCLFPEGSLDWILRSLHKGVPDSVYFDIWPVVCAAVLRQPPETSLEWVITQSDPAEWAGRIARHLTFLPEACAEVCEIIKYMGSWLRHNDRFGNIMVMLHARADTCAHQAAKATQSVDAAAQARLANSQHRRAARNRLPAELAAEIRSANTRQRSAARHKRKRDDPDGPAYDALPPGSLTTRAEEVTAMRLFHQTTPVVPRLPPYIRARQDTIFAGRVQDLPDKQPQQHVPYSEHIKMAEALAATASAQMPSLVCAVCSCVCPDADIKLLSFDGIPNRELLRADISRTCAVPRCGNTLYRRQMPLAEFEAIRVPPAPVPRAGEQVARTNATARATAAAAGQQGEDEEQLVDGETTDSEGDEPPAQRQRTAPYAPVTWPPRVRTLPVRDGSGTMNVKYCMRAELELPDRTTVNGRFQVCNTCLSALKGWYGTLRVSHWF